MIPGMPFIALGRNPWIAWGGSHLHAIASELLDISHLPEAALETREERIRVRWSAARKIRIRTCEAGPVLSDSILYRAPEERLALGWVGHRASDEITAMLNVSRAKNWEEFKAAINSFAVPGQNMIFAGSTGDIGHALAAWVPKDAQDTPDDLITRADSARSDFHTAESLPSWHDPPAGFVVSANNRPDTKVAVGRLFSSPDRAERITAILRSTSTNDFPLLGSIQRDVQADSAKKLAACLAQIARAGSSGALAPKSARILSLLEGWNGEYEAKSQAPAAFEMLLFHFCRLYYPSMCFRPTPRYGLFATSFDPISKQPTRQGSGRWS